MGSSGEAGTATIHVRLLDEPVPVWRPVRSKALGNGRFVILPQEIPDYEKWEFAPGETVAVEAQLSASGGYLKATAHA
jgi:hypothetical protein